MHELLNVLDAVFGLSSEPRQLTVGQMSVRALVVFVCALVMLRLAHKRFFASRNALDVLLMLILASTLSRAINGSAPYFPTLAIGLLLVLAHRFVSYLAARSETVGALVKGHSSVLVENGRVHDQTLRQHSLTREDLDEDLRINGVEKTEHVRLATLERNGEVSVVKS